MVEDDDIHLTISTFGANLENATKQLIQLGNDNGGKDNISVVVAEIMESFPHPAAYSTRCWAGSAPPEATRNG